MAEAQERINLGLLTLGMFFFLIYIVARYYIVLVLLPQGALTLLIVSVRDSILHIGIIVSAAGLVLPSAGFRADEHKIITYIFSITAIFFALGLYLNALKSPLSLYVVYNSGVILIVTSIATVLGYLGFRGRKIRSEETERIAMATLALTLAFNILVILWIFSTTSSGATVSPRLEILRTHSLRFSTWTVLAALIMKFSNPKERIYRLTVLGLAAASILWTATFTGYTLGLPMQLISGLFDILIGAGLLIAALSVWGFIGKRGPLTPRFTLGSLALIWLLIAGSVGLSLILAYSSRGLAVPAGWRVFHLMNANWSLTAGLAALTLASTRSPAKLGWIITLLFSADMVKAIGTYILNVFDPVAATLPLNLGEPFLAAAFLLIIYTLMTQQRQAAG